MGQTLPSSIRQKTPLDLGRALSETEALAHMAELAAQNQVFTSLIGQGYSGTILPAVIQRNILENPAWYTAYTPYQPEISQGRLEALFNFQTMICDLTGLDVANASLLDEATAAAEAMALAERASQVKAKSFFVDCDAHPQTLALLRTRAEPLGWNLIVGDPSTDLDKADVFGALLQYPASSGAVRDLRPAITSLRAKGGLAVVAADLLALTLIGLARRTRRRYRDRIGAALWRADGLWRAACRLHGGARRAEALAARPHRRSVGGFARRAGLSAGTANPRAAYPPRKGHLQHLHRAGAAGGDRLDVCGLSRPRRTDAYRAPGAPARFRAGGRIEQARLCAALAKLLRYGHGDVRRKAGRDHRARPRREDQSARRQWHARDCRGRDHHACHDRGGVARVRRQAVVRGNRSRRARGASRRTEAWHRVPDPSGVPRPSLRDRTAALHAQAQRSRPRARSRDDSAGLLHHEAQCDRGNDPADLGGVRQPASVCTSRAGEGLSRAVRAAGKMAVRYHRL